MKVIAGLLAAHGLTDTSGVLNTPDTTAAVLLVGSAIWSHLSHDAGGPTKPRYPLFLALLFGSLCIGQAQTNTPTATTNAPTDFWSGIGTTLNSIGISTSPTNYAVAPFVGCSTDGGDKLCAGLLLVENVSENVGIVAGLDHLWFGGKTASANIVSGGVTLKAPTHPLRFLTGNTNTWAYNAVVTPYALAMAGSPIGNTKSAGGGLSSIVRAGFNFDIMDISGWKLGAGADYGTRNGAGNYNGNWLDFTLNVRKNF